jgi:hypothetical protein
MLNAMHAALRRELLVVVAVVLANACAGSTPTAPAPITQSAVVPSPPVYSTVTFPPLSGPSRTFTFDHAPAPRVASYTTQSQFVLYDDGGFALRYPSPIGDYRGGYTESNGVITFEWEGWSVAGPWPATGIIKDGLLTVQYNLIMGLTDFEDAVYRLAK